MDADSGSGWNHILVVEPNDDRRVRKEGGGKGIN